MEDVIIMNIRRILNRGDADDVSGSFERGVDFANWSFLGSRAFTRRRGLRQSRVR